MQFDTCKKNATVGLLALGMSFALLVVNYIMPAYTHTISSRGRINEMDFIPLNFTILIIGVILFLIGVLLLVMNSKQVSQPSESSSIIQAFMVLTLLIMLVALIYTYFRIFIIFPNVYSN